MKGGTHIHTYHTCVYIPFTYILVGIIHKHSLKIKPLLYFNFEQTQEKIEHSLYMKYSLYMLLRVKTVGNRSLM